MSECIFCKMVAGEIRPDVIYEDDDVLAFKQMQHRRVAANEDRRSVSEAVAGAQRKDHPFELRLDELLHRPGRGAVAHGVLDARNHVGAPRALQIGFRDAPDRLAAGARL